MFTTFSSKKDEKIKAKLEDVTMLEEAGHIEAAKYLITRIVQTNPDCKACRYHMGKLFGEDFDASKKAPQDATPTSIR